MRTLSLRYFPMICLLWCSVNSPAQMQKPPNLAEIAAFIKQRDGKIQSLQMWGVLQRGSSGGFVPPAAPPSGNNSSSTPTMINFSNGEEFYSASIGDKEVISSREVTGQMTGQKLTPEMQRRIRTQLLEMNPKVFDGKVNFFVAGGGAHKTVLLQQGKKDVLFGETRLGFRSGSDMMSLDKLLIQQHYKFVGYEVNKQFGRLIRLKGTTTRGEANEIWLAPKRDYLVVKEEKVNRGLTRSEVTTMRQIKGLWVPATIVYSINPSTDGTSPPQFRSTIIRSAISLNDAAETVCTVAINPGDTVNDMETGEWWTVGQNGERQYQNARGNNALTQTLSGLPFTISVATMLLVTSIAYVWWKHKQPTSAV